MVAVAKKVERTHPVTHLRFSTELIRLADELVVLESRKLGVDLTRQDLIKRAAKIGLEVLAEEHGLKLKR